MVKKYSYELIVSIVKQAEAGATGAELGREHGIHKGIITGWRVKYKGMDLAMMEDRKKRLLARKREIPVAVKEAAENWTSITIGKRRSPEGKQQCLRVLQAIAKAWGGGCLSVEYKNSSVKLSFHCREGHCWESYDRTILRGGFCPVCYGKGRHTLRHVQEMAAKRGWQCLSTHYENRNAPMLWRCKNGHELVKSAGYVAVGKGCMQCLKDSWPSLETMHKVAKERGGYCLAEHYENAITPISWQCHRGHIWDARASMILRGHWCPQCNFLGQIRNPHSKARRKYEIS